MVSKIKVEQPRAGVSASVYNRHNLHHTSHIDLIDFRRFFHDHEVIPILRSYRLESESKAWNSETKAVLDYLTPSFGF